MTIAHHTSPQEGVIVWGAISYDSHFWHTEADQMVQWLGKPAAVPEVPGSNPG